MEEIQKQLRRKILTTCAACGEGHIGGSFSVVDTLYVLYSYAIQPPIEGSKQRPAKVILSKGHASLALYTVLNHLGVVSDDLLASYCQHGSILGGHPCRNPDLGIWTTTGSLGNGLSVAIGMAMGDPETDHFVVIGDGEAGEGMVWEALLTIAHNQITNVIPVFDMNQSHTGILNVMRLPFILPPLGIRSHIVQDGHDLGDISARLMEIVLKNDGKARALVVKTTKGHGVSFMAGQDAWHRRIPNPTELEAALKELEETTT